MKNLILYTLATLYTLIAVTAVLSAIYFLILHLLTL